MAICCKNKIIHLLERFFRRNHIKTTDEAINVVKSFSDAKVLYKKLFGKNVRFISNCEFFPNFDVIIKVNKIYIKGSEINCIVLNS